MAVLAVGVVGQDKRLPANFSLQVHGLVRYAANRQPAERVLVRIESFDGGLIGQVTTDRGGKFAFTGLTAKQYVVTAHAPGYLDVRERVDLLTANSGYLNLELVVDPAAVGKRTEPNGSEFKSLPVINASIPTDAQAEYAKATALLQTKKAEDTREAIKNLERALTIYPRYLDAQVMLGLAYMDLQQWGKAEKALRAAIEIDQRATTAYLALGETLLREKEFADGEKVILEGLKQNPESAPAHLTLAKIYWEMAPSSKDETQFRTTAEKAWKEVTKASTLDPNLGEAHVLAGNMLLRARRAQDALARFEQALKLEPNGPLANQISAIIKKIKDTLARSAKEK